MSKLVSRTVLEHVIMPKIVYQRFYVSNFMKQIQN